MLGLGLALLPAASARVGHGMTAGGSRSEAGREAGCEATDRAPTSISVLAAPRAGARIVATLTSRDVPALANLDAEGTTHGDWLEVRSGGTVGWVSGHDVTCRLTTDSARRVIAADAARVMAALRAADMAALARRVHPTKGVRLSPYATVDPETDVVMTAAELRVALRDRRRRIWGSDDGSAKPIRMTFHDYYRRFVYDRDFARAPRVTYNAPGDGTRKAWDAYASAIVADFKFPETDTRTAESLRLVFQRHRGVWYLAGIIHDGWTI